MILESAFFIIGLAHNSYFFCLLRNSFKLRKQNVRIINDTYS